MPQMAPMMWIPLSLTSFFVLLLIMSNIYFYSKDLNNSDSSSLINMNQKKNWKW